jgi:hypothetical protein
MNKPECITYSNGDKEWFLNGKRFTAKMALLLNMTDGGKEWYLNGNLHREDGPAAEFSNGSKFWRPKP